MSCSLTPIVKVLSLYCHCEEPHHVLVINVVDLQSPHGVNERLDGGNDVLVHQSDKAFLVRFAVALPVDDPHLLDEGALPALTSPCWTGPKGWKRKKNQRKGRNYVTEKKGCTHLGF